MKAIKGKTSTQLIVGIFIIAVAVIAAFYFFWTGAGDAPFLAGGGAGECAVLSDEYCTGGALIEEGEGALGFVLPEGTPIYAPISGQVMHRDEFFIKQENASYRLFNIEFHPNGSPDSASVSFTVIGNIVPTVESGSYVEKGDVVARTAKGRPLLGNDIVLSFETIGDEGYFVPQRELLAGYFTAAR